MSYFKRVVRSLAFALAALWLAFGAHAKQNELCCHDLPICCQVASIVNCGFCTPVSVIAGLHWQIPVTCTASAVYTVATSHRYSQRSDEIWRPPMAAKLLA